MPQDTAQKVAAYWNNVAGAFDTIYSGRKHPVSRVKPASAKPLQPSAPSLDRGLRKYESSCTTSLEDEMAGHPGDHSIVFCVTVSPLVPAADSWRTSDNRRQERRAVWHP
jgi:hypothetical protein